MNSLIVAEVISSVKKLSKESTKPWPKIQIFLPLALFLTESQGVLAEELWLKGRRKKRRHPLVKRITPNAIVRRMRMGESSVSVCLDFFGESGPECFSEGNVVYINRDHSLFIRESRKAATYTMHIARLITQEISLMKETRSPRVAFNRQSKLLKDAFAEE